MLNFIKRGLAIHDVVHDNGVHCGTLEQEVDGFFVFWPDNRAGFWSGSFMSEVASKLSELNRGWHQEIDKLNG